MITEDLKALSEIGAALWANPDLSVRAAEETMTAASLLDLAPERTVERASAALLERAERDGASINVEALQQPFFRLLPEERFLLSALHVGRWSYARVGRVLAQDADSIARRAWAARLHLASRSGFKVIYPPGSKKDGTRCPEYDAHRPWTQTFLDDEMSRNDQLFLQNHILTCEGCKQALRRCRELYYQVDSLIPRSQRQDQALVSLEEIWKETQGFRHPSQRTFKESLKVFGARPDVRWILGVSFLGLIWKIVQWRVHGF